jgi:hypothetical protein
MRVNVVHGQASEKRRFSSFCPIIPKNQTFWHGIQVECDFRALAKDRKTLTKGIRPAKKLAQP